MQTEAKIYTFGYGTPIRQFLILHQVIVARRFRRNKISEMTNEERQLVKECRIMVIGTDTFVAYLKSELKSIGFSNIVVGNISDCQKNITAINIISEYGDNVNSRLMPDMFSAPIIYPFDFVSGAGAIVIMPGDDKELLAQTDLRLWAAEYISGYCAFWNMEGCDWLSEALPEIKAGVINESAQRLAAHICARIAANIAVGREVKHFPRFYLAESEG
jgi:hypothetical protein